MKKVMLLQRHIPPYRLDIFKLLSGELRRLGYELHVVTSRRGTKPEFACYRVTKVFRNLYYLSYRKILKRINPEIIIIQGELKILNLYHSLIYSRIKRKKLIFWTHGYHRKKLDSIFRKIMKLADAILLYTPYIRDYPEHKTFYANNSLYFSEKEISLRNRLIKNKQLRKKQLGVGDKYVAIFCGRLYKEKKVDLIIKMFQQLDNFHLFAIGDGEDFHKIKNLVKKNEINNITLLGEIRDFEKKSRYFSAADFGVLTGLIGLNIVDYFFWGLPLIGLAGKHSPEIYYLKNNLNGFLCSSIEEMREKAITLVSGGKLPEMSKNAIRTYNTEANHKKMIKGFVDTIKYVEDR